MQDMKRSVAIVFSGVALLGVLGLVSCHSSYELTSVSGSMMTVDSKWDTLPDARATALLAPYKGKVDSLMHRVVGVSEMTMGKGKPESLLSNLIADVLRESATQVLGKPADMALVNLGGLRNILSKGEITCEDIYEILPFENSLCVVTVKGSTLLSLFDAIARKGSDGVSGVKLRITDKGNCLNGTIGGKRIEEEKLYTVATIDYLADGNDGMAPLAQAVKRECPEGATLRGLFMDYVERQTAAGKKITSCLDGRVTREREYKQDPFRRGGTLDIR